MKAHKLIGIEDYEKFIGAESIDRILNKALRLKDANGVFINSTFYGGGVAELLAPLALLFNSTGIKTGWRVIQGDPDFFTITKKIHNALQGDTINLTDRKKQIYEDIVYENTLRNHIDHDFVIIHDPQPLPMINYYRRRGPWIWRCHVDLTNPNKELWQYLRQFIDRYDAVIFTLKEYQQELNTPQIFFMPAIDPFSMVNREMSEEEINKRIEHYNIPLDLPIITQISRFDKWKDPEGVIQAFKLARKDIKATLVLLGNIATDDPEGETVYNSLKSLAEERIIILGVQDSSLVNALQRKSAVILQKSLREGFGLTVSEAMWKGTPVIGGNAGGIRSQITDGFNGFLVSSIEEAAARIIQIVTNSKLREHMGKNARETVRQKFLLTRYFENYLDLLNSFEAKFILNNFPGYDK